MDYNTAVRQMDYSTAADQLLRFQLEAITLPGPFPTTSAVRRPLSAVRWQTCICTACPQDSWDFFFF